jgi:hypothetical protein
MNRSIRALRWGTALGAVAAFSVALSASDLHAGDKKKDDKKGPHLRYATTYAEAWAEAKARNTLIYATWHKDN